MLRRYPTIKDKNTPKRQKNPRGMGIEGGGMAARMLCRAAGKKRKSINRQ
jgi:hypothetical protein